jgi:uncharacterized protein (DUF4415 family)
MPSHHSPGPILPMRKRGRPRQAPTTVVHLRISAAAFDAYARAAVSARVSVRSVLRHVLELRAPRD